jgi:YHS domain-containing protein
MIPARVSEYLDRNQARYSLLSHPTAYTAQEEAAAAHVPGREWAKTVVSFADTTRVTDPVCGDGIDDNAMTWRSEHRGETYYFCSQSCKMEFDDNPFAYATH